LEQKTEKKKTKIAAFKLKVGAKRIKTLEVEGQGSDAPLPLLFLKKRRWEYLKVA